MLLLKKIITRELKLCNIIYKKIKENKILQENRCKSKTKVQLMKKVVKKLRKTGLKDQHTMAHNFWSNLSRLIDPGAQI